MVPMLLKPHVSIWTHFSLG